MALGAFPGRRDQAELEALPSMARPPKLKADFRPVGLFSGKLKPVVSFHSQGVTWVKTAASLSSSCSPDGFSYLQVQEHSTLGSPGQQCVW